MSFYSTPSKQLYEEKTGTANVSTLTDIKVKFRDTSAQTSGTQNIVGTVLKTDLTDGYAEQIMTGSARFSFGDSVYIDKMGTLYRDPSITTGSGSPAGQIFYSNGAVEINAWNPGKPNNPILQSLVTQIENTGVSAVSFRAPIVPLRVESLTVTAIKIKDGGTITVRPNASGIVNDEECQGEFNFEYGLGQFVFRKATAITSANRAEIEAQSWYDVRLEYTSGAIQLITEPVWVYPDSIKFSCVGYTYIPLNAELLGLDPVRLPSDGRVPIFRSGEVVVIHNTQHAEVQNPTPLATFNVGRNRLSYIKLYDSKGVVVDQNTYTTNPDLGEVTLLSNFTTTDLELPIVAEHRVEDAAMCTDAQINGELTLNVPISHAYTSGQTFVSSALMLGDMQARVHNVFSQGSWMNTWSDAREGAQINAQYNNTLYPLQATNEGCIEERWAIIFINSTTYRLVGEHLGVVGEGISINSDYSPINPVTNTPYITLFSAGFGSGWAAGNVLRFNTAAASHPFWVNRTVKQGQSTIIDDSFQIQARCGVNRP